MSQNKITELVSLYEQKKIEKYDYIDQMHGFNKTLTLIAERMPQTDIAKIEIQDGGLLFTTKKDQIRMLFSGKDRRGVPFDMLNFGSYEKEDATMLFNLIEEDACIFDIGANLGWYALLFSKRLPLSTIHSFEPIKQTYHYLITNTQLNNSKNIITHNLALSDKKGTFEYYYFPEGSVLASEKNLIKCDKSKKIKCEVETLER